MAPNATEINIVEGNFQYGQKNVQERNSSQDNVALTVVRSSTTLVTHILIGIVVGVTLLFSFRNGVPTGATNQHLLLCTIGYQLLMAEAILSLAPDSWVSGLKLRHKRLVHLVMQVGGSLLAIVGSFIKIADKDVHWNTLHGRFALVALVFTTVSLVNGLASFYANGLRRIVPGILSKITHICFGIVAFGAASIALCYGFDKNLFRNWQTSQFADVLIAMTCIFTFIVIINPFLTFYKRLRGVFN